jgi:hypothetical protein
VKRCRPIRQFSQTYDVVELIEKLVRARRSMRAMRKQLPALMMPWYDGGQRRPERGG